MFHNKQINHIIDSAHFVHLKWSQVLFIKSLIITLALSFNEGLVDCFPATSGQGMASASASAGVSNFPAPSEPLPPSPRANPNADLNKLSRLNMQRKQQQILRQKQLDQLFNDLINLENKASENLDDCSNWLELNTKYIQLAGQQQTRQSEINKRIECDNLKKATEDSRNRLNKYKQLLLDEDDQLEFVSELVNELMNIRKESFDNVNLNKEFHYLIESDEQIRLGTEQIDQFLELMKDLINVSNNQRSLNGNDLQELDLTLKQFIDRENDLNEQDLDQLTELTGILDNILSSGLVDLSSGKFRYLSGTLDASRAVLLKKALSNEAENDKQEIEHQAASFTPSPLDFSNFGAFQDGNHFEEEEEEEAVVAKSASMAAPEPSGGGEAKGTNFTSLAAANLGRLSPQAPKAGPNVTPSSLRSPMRAASRPDTNPNRWPPFGNLRRRRFIGHPAQSVTSRTRMEAAKLSDPNEVGLRKRRD